METEWEERSSSPSRLSLKSDSSLEEPLNFKCSEENRKERNVRPDETQLSVDGTQATPRGKEVDEYPQMMEDWTSHTVKEWLIIHLKIPLSIAQSLYDKEMTGAALASFEKQDLFDLGVPPALALQIVRQVERFRRPSEMSQKSARLPGRAAELRGNVHNYNVSAGLDDYTDVETGSSETGFQSQSPSLLLLKELRNKINSIQNTTDHGQLEKEPPRISTTTTEDTAAVHPAKTIRLTRPFDLKDPSFLYTENDILPPPDGPSNLLDPVHEYHILPSIKKVSEIEIIYKFTTAVFSFAASCMNSRTNGTIHFGVKSQLTQECGRVIGQEITSFAKYSEAFELNLRWHFEEEHVNVAKTCIRPPKFIQIQCLDGTTSDKWVIEVDVVPTHSVTQETVFYTFLKIATAGDEEQCKTECLFVREGPTAINILEDPNPRATQQKIKIITDKIISWALARKSAENKEGYRSQAPQGHQGKRLRQLITRGSDMLENIQLIVITNKCHPSQLEYLGFLKDMKPFAVLDFDPESDINGTCSFYRKDNIANIHYPHMYTTQDSFTAFIGKLNLFRQTSWVFCNGRVNEDTEMNKPLNPVDWLKIRSGGISNMVSFLCNSNLLSRDGLLVVFILHSAVTDISSPIIETFCAIYRTMEGHDNMLCICKDSDVFNNWRQLIETRCKVDITGKCIYELSLNEINSTINKLKEPQTQSYRRYLPSSGFSPVLLTKKDEGMMTALNILSENECENTEIEANESFHEFKTKIEEDFYRGGQVTWWNFYLSERPGCLPFIKRDKYSELYGLITPTEGYTSPCVMVNLFHHPGCGGTTLAMHILWNLRNTFRCAVVKNNMVPNSEVAVQVRHLLSCGNQEQSVYTPVLLLVDNWNNMEDLKQCILSVLSEKNRRNNPTVIVLNCERTQFPTESSRKSLVANVFLNNKLSLKEKSLFAEKLEQLKDHHDKPETFYAFMIMTMNFSETYIKNLVNNILTDLDPRSQQGRLICFLTLLNTFVNGSYMSLSLCEELVGIRFSLWNSEKLEEKMNPYSTLLIISTVEEHGTYRAVRFLHQMIAKSCLKVFNERHKLSCSELTTDMLHCDILYKSLMGKDFLEQNIQSMLIKRYKKEKGDDKNTLFSPLIEQIYEKESPDKVEQILQRASLRFNRSATLPQALARHFYLKDKNYVLSLKWAKDALEKKSNSYIADTIGQVYKSQLKDETNCLEHLTPEVVEKCLKLASNAIKAFRNSQELAETDKLIDPYEPLDGNMQRLYNMSGYAGEAEVTLNILKVIQAVPLFTISDSYKKDTMLQFLKGTWKIKSCHGDSNETNNHFIRVLTDNETFLISLQPRLKKIFGVFEEYFTYLKPRSLRERDTTDDRNKIKLSQCFKRYIEIFCTSSKEKESEKACNPKLSLAQQIADQRDYLEIKRADSFAGLLHYLNEKNGLEMEIILRKWEFLINNSPHKTTSDRINFILANIVLHSINPNSKLLKKYGQLVSLLNEALQQEGTNSNVTELYFLFMVLMWPTKHRKFEHQAAFQNISSYITLTKKSFHRRFSHMMPARSAITHFFLGHNTGLKRIVSKGKIDQACASNQISASSGQSQPCKPYLLWQTGAVWKDPEVQRMLLRVKGKTENREIYVNCGSDLRIQVRPIYLGGIRSGGSQEEVSFYLGFSMEGPVAYDIKYENEQ